MKLKVTSMQEQTTLCKILDKNGVKFAHAYLPDGLYIFLLGDAK